MVIGYIRGMDTASVIFTNENNRLSLSIPRGHKPEQFQYEYAEMLTSLRYIYENIEKFRELVGLQVPYDFLEEHHYVLPLSMPIEYKSHLETYSRRILDHYGLSQAWLLPFQVALLTHTLPVPIEDRIELLMPIGKTNPDNNFEDLLNFKRRNEIVDSEDLLLVIPEHMSVEQIRTFLSKNKIDIDEKLHKLGKKKPKTEKRTIVCGQAASLVKQDNPSLKWPEILKEVEKMLHKDSSKIKPPHTGDELQKMYNRYIETLKNLEFDSKS